MKFLCDRCKTRYSIGDDRVRGKILKIRCKNCANVITVREGMTADEAPAAPVDRRMRPTTAAPMASATVPAGSALASAFVSQMTKPPPALEEEWYVSIDGDQSGPFSLAEAQRWIAGKPFDAELHCWSEGFDDWLPVDKVSHFRGLRKRPAPPTAPPPLPRAVSRVVAAPPPPLEDEPKPLFAATMASLEKGSGPSSAAGLGLPAIASVPAPKSGGVSAHGMHAKTNGTSPIPRINDSAPVPRLGDSAPVPRLGSPAPSAKAPAIPTKPGSGPARSPTVQGMSAGAKALASAFDVTGDPAESMTSVDAPSFRDEIATTAEPVSAKRAFDQIDAIAKGTNGSVRHAPAAAPSAVPELPDDDEMEIGEVSRVVKLADIVKMGPGSGRASKPQIGRATGALAARGATGAVPKYEPTGMTGSMAKLDPAQVAALQQPMLDPNDPNASQVVAPVVAQVHRRGLIMLIGFASLLLAGVTVAVVLMINNSNDDTGGGLGHTKEIDTSRPEDIVRRQMMPNDTSSGSAASSQKGPVHHYLPHPNGSNGTGDDTPGTGARLKSEEIEAMAGKNSGGTQRCYMRAQRGAAGIEIQDLRKLSVTITIDKTGAVSDVQFSEKTSEQLLGCLRTQIKLWKFRESPGGMYRFVLAFAS